MKTFTEKHSVYLYSLKKEVIKSIKKNIISLIKIHKNKSVDNQCTKLFEHEEYGTGLDCIECNIDITLESLSLIDSDFYGIYFLYINGLYDENYGFVKWTEIKIESLIKLADYLNHFKKNI